MTGYGGKKHYLGCFGTKEEAALTCDRAARKHGGGRSIRLHQLWLWVRGHRVRTEPARTGSVVFWGGALRCLAGSEAPPQKKKIMIIRTGASLSNKAFIEIHCHLEHDAHCSRQIHADRGKIGLHHRWFVLLSASFDY
jgi:hypothetical protein